MECDDLITVTEKSKCSGCHACYNACPKGCIQMIADEEGFWYPQVDKSTCVNCEICEKVCPVIHKFISDNSRGTRALAAINSDTETRLISSSGGIFTLLAEWILKKKGVVFGATFSDDFQTVNHIYIDDVNNITKLQGSKYVQSKIGTAYEDVKSFLDMGRMVLFTGTPCQIGGLYSYLRKNYPNLFTQDIICHGVPSPLVWKKYLEERERKAKSRTTKVFFRNKKYGWKAYSVFLEFTNKKVYIKGLSEDSFMRAFLSNACLRPSCYNCSFKSVKRQSDLTLADFWGVQSVSPELDDDKGTSIVIIHSKKGEELFSGIRNQIICTDTNLELIKKYNSSIVESAKINPNRRAFMDELQVKSFDKTVDKYFKISIKRRIRIILTKSGLIKVLKKS